VHRKVVIPNDFITDLAQIEQRPAQFEACYNATALPRVELHTDRPRRAAVPHRRA